VDLAGIGGEQMLQRPEDLLNQIATRPDAQQACGGNLSGQAEQIEPILAGFVDQDEGDLTIGGAFGSQPGIATARCMETLPPGPLITFD
jgi:hypothetical protein